MVFVDDVLFGQVLWNLLENAAKYTAPGTPVDLAALEEDGAVIIEIRDRGPGITHDAMVRLKIATDDTHLENELRDLEERTERQVEVIRQLFGSNVFSDEVMRSRLPENVYKALRRHSCAGPARRRTLHCRHRYRVQLGAPRHL